MTKIGYKVRKSPKKLNGDLVKVGNEEIVEIFDEKEEEYLQIRLDNPTLDLYALSALVRTDSSISLSEVDVFNFWNDDRLNAEYGARLDALIERLDTRRRGRLLEISDSLLGVIEGKIYDYQNGVDDPRSLMTGSDPFTARQAALIVKNTLHGMSLKDIAAMAKELHDIAARKDEQNQEIDGGELMDILSLNYHKFLERQNRFIDVEQFSVEEGFEGETLRGDFSKSTEDSDE